MGIQCLALRPARSASALCLLLSVGVPRAAFAEPGAPSAATATQRETARGWWQEGRELFEKKDYPAALERFTAAYGIVRVPTVGIELARTQAAMGKWVEANATAIEVINLPSPPDEPKVFAEARAHAKELMQRLTPLIPSLRINVAPVDIAVRVEIDGEPMTVPGRSLSFRLNPGGHELLVSAPGYLTARRTVALRQKEQQTVSVTLVPESTASPPSADGGPSTNELFGEASPAGERPGPWSAPSTLGYIALGTAGVATLVGGITGTLAFTTLPSCPSGRCTANQRDDVDASLRYGNVATVSFGVAIAAGAYGLWELLAGGAAETAPSESLAGARVTPLSSGALLEVSGSF